MGKQRKDHKGRILKPGESQRKDLIYQYRYTNSYGKRITIYDSDLQSLRQKEREINKQLHDGIDFSSAGIKFIDLIRQYVDIRQSIRNTTKENYKFAVSVLETDIISSKKIRDIKPTDGKKLVIRLSQNGERYKYKSVDSILKLVKAAFTMAVDDGMLYRNPFSFKLSDVIANDSKPRQALTSDQQRDWMNFVSGHEIYKKYYDQCVVLLGTGMRVSELCGLTDSDIDFKNGRIRVDHQLLKTPHGRYYIERPKTNSGCRFIPMTDVVRYSLAQILLNRKPTKHKVVIDGYENFVFINKDRMPQTSHNISKWMSMAYKQYMELHPKSDMPKITPHVLRHTFCTNMVHAGVDIKSLQYLMGHATAEITLDIYSHTDYNTVESQVKNAAPKIIYIDELKERYG